MTFLRSAARRKPRQNKRPLSKGPRQRAATNHGNGKKFEKGQNSHDGTVFRRGPDQIPRGNGLLMLRTVFLDARQQIYDNLCKLVGTPKGAHAFVMDYTDRTEGKAKQTVQHNVRRTTTFGPAPEMPAIPPPEAAGDTGAETIGPDGERMVQL